MKLKRLLTGGEIGGDVLAVQRALNKAPSQTMIGISGVYDGSTERRVRSFRRARSLPAGTHFDQTALNELWPYFDAYGRMRYLLFRIPRPRQYWQDIGPVQPGGISLLDMSLTHDTSNIPLFPAVDTAWGGGGGVEIIAPEDAVVDTKDTSSSPGEAIYLTGKSELRHWIGHLDRDWPLEHRFKKGDFIGKTLPIPGSSDHGHWGVNGEAILGKGKEFLWGGAPTRPQKRYQLGSPTIRAQLERALL